MAPKFKAWSAGSSSTESSDEESISREDGGPLSMKKGKGVPKKCGTSSPSRPKTGDVARQNATNFQLPNLEPHQHSALFYLSLIEGRCRTQAANSINAARVPEEALPEDHPEVCELARHLFTEMSRELSKAGVLPAEFAGPELAELRAGYLSSFDQILDSIASKRSHEIPEGPQAPEQTLDIIRHAGTTPYLGVSQAPATTQHTMAQYPNNNPFSSGYFSDFSELGTGASGSVVKAKHLVDGMEYAIKKIKLPKHLSTQAGTQTADRLLVAEVLDETQGLAKLTHDNVVRYYTSWFEFDTPPSPSYNSRNNRKAIGAKLEER